LYQASEKQIVLAPRGRQLRPLRMMCFPERSLDRLLLSQNGLELVGTGLAPGTWCKRRPHLTIVAQASYNCKLNILPPVVAEGSDAQAYVSAKEEKAKKSSRIPYPHADAWRAKGAQSASAEGA